MLFVRLGGTIIGTEEADEVRPGIGCVLIFCGGPGGVPLASCRPILATSIECDRESSGLISNCARGRSAPSESLVLRLPQCWASRDLLSSIGVKMLWFLACAGRGLG